MSASAPAAEDCEVGELFSGETSGDSSFALCFSRLSALSVTSTSPFHEFSFDTCSRSSSLRYSEAAAALCPPDSPSPTLMAPVCCSGPQRASCASRRLSERSEPGSTSATTDPAGSFQPALPAPLSSTEQVPLPSSDDYHAFFLPSPPRARVRSTAAASTTSTGSCHSAHHTAAPHRTSGQKRCADLMMDDAYPQGILSSPSCPCGPCGQDDEVAGWLAPAASTPRASDIAGHGLGRERHEAAAPVQPSREHEPGVGVGQGVGAKEGSSCMAALVQHLAASYYAEFGAVPDVPQHLEEMRSRGKRQRLLPTGDA